MIFKKVNFNVVRLHQHTQVRFYRQPLRLTDEARGKQLTAKLPKLY